METSGDQVRAMVLKVEGVSKSFNRRNIFRDISIAASVGDSVAVTGKNGSGKSTLIRIFSGLLSPSAGTVRYEIAGSPATMDSVHQTMGFVAPYLQLYDEFSALENIDLAWRIRSSGNSDPQTTENLLRRFNLWSRRTDFVRTYSSGMKQRLKYVVALGHNPKALMLDEPTANLDDEGTEVVKSIVGERHRDCILVVATNDDREAAWCAQRIHVGS